MYEVTIGGWFAASHQLKLLDGSLEPLHGHNWRVQVTFAGPRLDAMGVLVDFTQAQPRLSELLKTLHDRHLNDAPLLRGRNPSAEIVAAAIAERLADGLPSEVRLTCVEIEEAPGCVARYRPS